MRLPRRYGHSDPVTDPAHYADRRRFLGRAAWGAAGAALAAGGMLPRNALARLELGDLRERPKWSTGEDRTPKGSVTSYNNFYELGTAKSDPKRHADKLPLGDWSVAVEGEVGRPGELSVEELVAPHRPFEERVYRLRCVEGWSMVIPWVGFPLADLLARFEPTNEARFVEFTTLYDPENLPGQRRDVLDWPYVEGLRLDEARHPLTILAVGLYGAPLPPQNGAPLRLVVPWKYGFKSIKSIVRIRLTREQPQTTWNLSAPQEYGFYANVNPEVPHPRWSQATERRIGEFFRRETEMFNGYADHVAHLYEGMDLKEHF